MEQREIDNMLLSMIQKHFPSLPLSDEYTDWGKWLGFARAVYEAGRASPASVPEVWKLVPVEPTQEMVEAGCKSLGALYGQHGASEAYKAMLAAAPTPPVSEDRKDAERWRWITREGRTRELRIPASENKASIDAAIDSAIKKAMEGK